MELSIRRRGSNKKKKGVFCPPKGQSLWGNNCRGEKKQTKRKGIRGEKMKNEVSWP